MVPTDAPTKSYGTYQNQCNPQCVCTVFGAAQANIPPPVLRFDSVPDFWLIPPFSLPERTHSFTLIHSVNHTVFHTANHSLLHHVKLGRFHIVVDSFHTVVHSVDNRKKERTHSFTLIHGVNHTVFHTVFTVWTVILHCDSHCEWVWMSVFFPAGLVYHLPGISWTRHEWRTPPQNLHSCHTDSTANFTYFVFVPSQNYRQTLVYQRLQS